MRTRYTAIIAILLSTLGLMQGCKNNPPANSNTGRAVSTNANQSRLSESSANTNSTGSGQAADSTTSSIPPNLFGTFEISEVHKGGVVTIITVATSNFTFKRDGTYRRESKRKGLVYHYDEGKYHIEAPSTLVLSIENTNKGPKKPPIIISHPFTLSHDGKELKMEAEEGSSAIYRKVGNF